MQMNRWIIVWVVALTGALSAMPVLQAEPGATHSTASATLAVKKLSVNGMTCFGCVQAVEAALQDIEGVSQVDVSLTDNEAVVEYDPALVEPKVLIAAVTESGFEAALKETDESEIEALAESETIPE